MKRRKLLIPPTLREGFIIRRHNDMALRSAYERQLVRSMAFSMAARNRSVRDGGRSSLARGRRGVDGLRFYPFCPLTSLQAATCQTARPRSLSWEYKQRADDRASIISLRPDPLVLLHSPPALSLHLVPPRLFLLLSFSRPYFPLHFRFTPPPTFRPLAIFLATFGHDPSYSNPLSFSLSRTGGSFCAVETWQRRPPRGLNSSLPAPFPEFSSVKSAPLLHPSPPPRPPRDDS